VTGLRISDAVALPIDIVTEAVAILARRGRGKTYTASVFAEEMLKRDVQIVVVDPTGAWWGLRSSADGSKGGYPVIIMGGEHGDVPLEPTAGAAVADFVVQERFSVVLDLSLFESRADEIRFMTAFAERLYRAKKKGTGVLHVFIDEASVFCPQNVKGDTARMVGAVEAIVRRGRIKGIGCTLIDQRPASVNKNVLTQAKGLIVLGISSPTDRKAITLWIDTRGADQAKEVVDELPSMSVGEAWVWFPDLDLVEKVQVRERETFDSSATPKAGEVAVQPRRWTKVDLEAVARRMADTIERAKADDPAELKKTIVALRKDLRLAESKAKGAGQVEPPEPVEIEVPVEVPLLDKKDRDHIWAVLKDLGSQFERIEKRLDEGTKVGTQKRTSAPVKSARKSHQSRSAPRSAPAQRDIPRDISQDIDEDFSPSKPQQRILNSLAWMESIGRDATAKTQLALLADARPTSGAYKNNLGALRSAGLISYPTAGQVTLTEAGRSVAVIDGVPSTNEELWEAIFAKVGPTKARILVTVIDVYPDMIGKEELAEQTDQRSTSGAYKNNLGFLRTMGLIDYPQPGFVAATDVLFLEGA
jgi:hypothetical protein